jgi:hypothetical protein
MSEQSHSRSNDSTIDEFIVWLERRLGRPLAGWERSSLFYWLRRIQDEARA